MSATPALADDLPSLKAAPVTPAVSFSWTGAYIGADLGYINGNGKLSSLGNDAVTRGQITGGTVYGSIGTHGDGVTAGGHVGYNLQLPSGGFVVGVEADIAYTGIDSTLTSLAARNVTNIDKQTLDYLGTARGRLGYAFDRTLVYGTGGFAYGHTSASQAILSNQTPPKTMWSGAASGLSTGWAAGGGIEYASDDTFLNPFGARFVTLRLEYLHYDLGARTFAVPGSAALRLTPYVFTTRAQTRGDLVRAGISYGFGAFDVAPVVAKY